MEYNFKEIEAKWQNVWYTQNTFAAKQDFSLPKYYCLAGVLNQCGAEASGADHESGVVVVESEEI